jgi:hypothetical protein
MLICIVLVQSRKKIQKMWATFHFCPQLFKRRAKSHMPFASVIRRFNVYGSVHRKYIPIYIQQDATLHILFISGNCYTCFGWYFHPSSGAHTTVSTASGICHTVTAVCRYRGRVGTGLNVHSTLKPVPTLYRTDVPLPSRCCILYIFFQPI